MTARRLQVRLHALPDIDPQLVKTLFETAVATLKSVVFTDNIDLQLIFDERQLAISNPETDESRG